jgi:hemolysin III
VARAAGVGAVILLAAGGILYTVGMVFLVTGRPRLWPRVFSYHELFHVLVVSASVLHFAAAYRYVAGLSS